MQLFMGFQDRRAELATSLALGTRAILDFFERWKGRAKVRVEITMELR